MGILERLKTMTRPGPQGWLRTAVNLFGHRRRRTWSEGSRAHIELRALDPAQFTRFADAVEATLAGLGGISGVHLNGLVGRVVIEFDATLWSAEKLATIIDAIELRLQLRDLPFAEAIPDYPADIEPLLRKSISLGADVVGVVLGTGLRIVGFSAGRAGFDVAAVMTVMDNTPRLRQMLVDRLGSAGTEVGVGVANALVQAVGAGPIGPLVDMLVQAVKLRGEQARRAAWLRREAELCAASASRIEPMAEHPRPTPLPESIVERYANDALFASLGGFVVGIADTHNIESALAPLFSGLPKAALYGRTIFAAELMVTLGRRGALVLRTAALRLLDRVDTVAIEAEVLLSADQTIATIVPAPGVARELVAQRAGRLFDGSTWSSVHVHEDWSLGPIEALAPAGLPAPLGAAAAVWRGRSLVLTRAGEAMALVHLRPGLRRDAEALLASIRRSRLHFVLAVDDPALARLLTAHERVPAADLADAVEDLQRHGRVVAVIAARSLSALARADVGIGLALDRSRPPWSADIILGEDLRDALFLVDACAVAREVAEQSVVLAGVGAALGAALALGGLRKTKPQQVMLATHAASVIALANGLRRATELSRRPAPTTSDPTPWHRLDSQAVLERLGSAADLGLASAVAAGRRHRPAPVPSRPLRFARAVGEELINPLTPVLVTGAALSAVTGSLLDAALIAAVFGLNAMIGGVERYQAEAAITAIERRERPFVRVLRSGRWDRLTTDELVEGDIVDLEAGEVVPADGRLLVAEDLEVDESSLTGESLPIAKDPAPSYASAIAERSSMLYEGTAIAVGRARVVVVATGAETEARRGMFALHELSPETGVEARLRRITEMTLPIAGLSGALLVGAGLFRHQDVHRLIDLGVSMTIAAVPEGLPLLATVAQLAAARRLSRRGALVRNPRTVEALGRLNVLCADKTGTLTEGKIVLHGLAEDGRDARVDDGELPPWALGLLAAALRGSPGASERGELPHPTDRAVVDSGARLGVTTALERPGWRRLHELPFEPGRGYHAVLGVASTGLWLSVKGAPEVLLPRCTRRSIGGEVTALDEAERAQVLAHAERLAGEGLRVLAVAEREASEERDLDDDRIGRLIFRGFVTLSDPPRATAAAAIGRLQAAGIALIMITGDHPRTARRIADELGLLGGRGVLTGPELEDMSDDTLDLELPRGRRDRPGHAGAQGPDRQGAAARRPGGGHDRRRGQRRLRDPPRRRRHRHRRAQHPRRPRRRGSGGRRRAHRDDRRRDRRGPRDVVVGPRRGGDPHRRQPRRDRLLRGRRPARRLVAQRPAAPARQPAHRRRADHGDRPASPVRGEPARPPRRGARGGPRRGPRPRHRPARDHHRRGRRCGLDHRPSAPGGRRGAPTVALLALVGTQLGQTLVTGQRTPAVLAASLGSAALMLLLVETPGVSHVFGCRPLGPVGLGIAALSSMLATGASLVAPPIVDRVRQRLAQRRGERSERSEPPLDVEIKLGPPGPATST